LDLLEEELAEAEEEVPEEDLGRRIVAFLTEKGVKTSTQGKLARALREENADHVREAVGEGADVNLPDVNRISPAMEAVRRGDKASLEVLKEFGADLSLVDNDGWTCAHFAAYTAKKDMLEFLLDSGADMEAISNYGRKPLDLIKENTDSGEIDEGDEENDLVQCASLLVGKGCTTSPVSDLYRAVLKNDFDAVIRAVEAGADVNATSKDLQTPFMMAKAPMMKNLVALGAELEKRDVDGWTAVHFAAQDDDPTRLEALDQLGADFHAETDRGRNAWDLSQDQGLCEAFLEAKGLRPSPQGRLWRCAEHGNLDGVEFAVSLGADVNLKDLADKSAADLAAANGHGKIVDFLKANGAVFEGEIEPREEE